MTRRPSNNMDYQETKSTRGAHVASHAAAPNNTSNSTRSPQTTPDDSSQLTRKRKKKKKKDSKRTKVIKVLLIILAVLLGLTLLTGVGLFIAFSIGRDSMTNPSEQMTEGKVIEYNGSTYRYNENIVSTLMIGYDQKEKDLEAGRSGQADFLLLVALDTHTGKITGISIPRDTMVEVGELVGSAYAVNNKDLMQICLAYAYGDGQETSCRYTVDAVSRLLYNMPIGHYLSLNLEGIGPINDAIGGVTLVPIETIPNTGIVKGEQITLMGNNARKYVQYRNTKLTESAEMRRARQVQYINEFYKQAFSNSPNKIKTALDLYNVAKEYACTNVGIPELTYMAQSVFANGFSGFEIKTVPGQNEMGEKYVEYYPDKTKTFELVLSVFYNKE